MVQEVILVVVDVSKEISSDYAMEWTIQNVTKSDDFIILLVVLPKPNLYQRLKSLACYFLSCEFSLLVLIYHSITKAFVFFSLLLRVIDRVCVMLIANAITGGANHSKGNSFDQIDQSKRDALQQKIYDYVHKMQKLCLANNLMQVGFTLNILQIKRVSHLFVWS
jgi:phosphate starvation-inducible membrane PsiE